LKFARFLLESDAPIISSLGSFFGEGAGALNPDTLVAQSRRNVVICPDGDFMGAIGLNVGAESEERVGRILDVLIAHHVSVWLPLARDSMALGDVLIRCSMIGLLSVGGIGARAPENSLDSVTHC